MKRRGLASGRVELAFTLIEMLVVIGIIGILAGLVLTGLTIAKINAQKKICQGEEASLVASIHTYYSQYSRMPISSNAIAAASMANGNYGDFTFGTVSNVPGMGSGQIPSLPAVSTFGETGTPYQNYNSEVMAILRDDNFYPEANNGSLHIYNPQQTPLSDPPKMTSDTNSPGLGPDDVLRDPWGDPYIITLDLNYDGRCFDYTLATMYSNNVPAPNPQTLMVPQSAIVWSFGPMKTINLSQGLSSPNSTNKQTIVASFQ